MTIQLLIDAIVRQVTVLIAQLATSGGIRAPLAHVANQVFLDLARELDAQGVSRKVRADMFGMALSTYVRKVRRLQESESERGKTLWEAVYEFIVASEVTTRERVLERFARDDEDFVRGVLHDLTDSQLVFASGSGRQAVYRAATQDDLDRLRSLAAGDPSELLWVIVYREGPVSRADLAKLARLPADRLDAVLDRLVEEGRIRPEGAGEGVRFTCRSFSIPMGSRTGWEAAVLDHLHAVVRTIGMKTGVRAEAAEDDTVGGTTFTMGVWPGHPLRDDVLGSLARIREVLADLQSRVNAVNSERGVPDRYEEVVVYGGQSVLEREKGDESQ